MQIDRAVMVVPSPLVAVPEAAVLSPGAAPEGLGEILGPPRPVYAAVKRGMDVVFGGLLLLLSLPVMALAALAVKLTSRGLSLIHI